MIKKVMKTVNDILVGIIPKNINPHLYIFLSMHFPGTLLLVWL